MQLQPGQLISAPFLPTAAEIKKFELRSGYALLEVVLHDGHQTYKPLRITPDQLAQIEILDQEPAAVAANAEDFFFFIEANCIRLAHQFDPQLAVNVLAALEYERSQGWSPQDVSGENHGFDIRSTLYDEDGSFLDICYIEVKARAQSGAVRISAN